MKLKIIPIMIVFSSFLFRRIEAKENCPLVLGHRGAAGVYPEDTVIFLFSNFDVCNFKQSKEIIDENMNFD